ncbi:bifunctional ADP-dependent NAD(P)H-hydrate dehydratase/NAD(P)H-hydrate epimerase [Alicyclobacillus vulcanalis]|uniref:Bifunctional NAD(P)H-hydrate repair enzyme n=1 Tax=Alicyclobacillus vulcanalis TaxID=252246 RepID=A0A1N7P4G9_9BACL|nr:bifunctional ADP-dependent NAD(P)H-hydrate dehydratase/NAD(P)H-hydrate epimerase [Alicyclobacillus vulcanalis]SIT05426.1 NAD(P)H-hydrate epimerase [Alicyclobacillus vulcanalis]
MYLVTSDEMRRFDHDTIQNLGVPAIVLMDHAGRAIAEHVRALRPQRVVALCGKGMNGGDGWVAARWLRHAGFDVTVISSCHPAALQGDARTAQQMAERFGVTWSVYEPGAIRQAAAAGDLSRDGVSPTVIIDALLGTGVSRPAEGVIAQMIEEANATSAYIVSADLPSGVDASTGEVPGPAIVAHETIAMAAEKLGTAVTPGAMHAGRVHVADVGIPVDPAHVRACYVSPAAFGRQFGFRGPMSHKGSFGKVGIALGQMPGASRLASLAALRAGAGLVVVAGSRAEAQLFAPDVVVREGSDPAQLLQDVDAVIVGPGLGILGREARTWLFDLVRAGVARGVIDAEALAAVAHAGQFDPVDGEFVLTPHPKEAARMLGWDVRQVQARRVEAARTLAARSRAIALLKGHRTIIAHPAGRVRVNPTGSSALAVAGTGDVLAGVIGALIAQGLDAFDAAAIGAWLHGKAGECAGEALTDVSVTASDVIARLPDAVRAYRAEVDASV